MSRKEVITMRLMAIYLYVRNMIIAIIMNNTLGLIFALVFLLHSTFPPALSPLTFCFVLLIILVCCYLPQSYGLVGSCQTHHTR